VPPIIHSGYSGAEYKKTKAAADAAERQREQLPIQPRQLGQGRQKHSAAVVETIASIEVIHALTSRCEGCCVSIG
jgi:hypothetical protein